MSDKIDSEEKVAVINTLGVTALKELLIQKGIFTRAEWTEMFDRKSDEFENLLKEKGKVK